mmetsp:Transcript_10743/g.29642  ORF Transcript_10743/g.29642 Transcript_10743/m.29642 type:complete len:204 (-) Transcript_10743:1478-2089(-)
MPERRVTRTNSGSGDPASLGLASPPSSGNSNGLQLPNGSNGDAPRNVGRRRRNPLVAASNKAFNPKLIFSQIVAMQCLHYVVLGFFFGVNNLLYGNSITIDRIFTDRYLNLWSIGGWADNFAVVLSCLCGSVLLAIIVEKSKKCLDFCVTLFLIHLLVCTLYNGIPATWDWWIIHIFSTIAMILLGEYVCSQRELDEIPLLQF